VYEALVLLTLLKKTAMMSDESKSLNALISGVIRHDYYHEKTITDDLLRAELYSTSSNDDFKTLVNRVRSLIKVRLFMKNFRMLLVLIPYE
jgi:COMMD1 N-terminal domain